MVQVVLLNQITIRILAPKIKRIEEISRLQVNLKEPTSPSVS